MDTQDTRSQFDTEYLQQVSHNCRGLGNLLDLKTGTGYSIYRDVLLPLIRTAKQEVVLVTCFWAPSVTRELLYDELIALSSKALSATPTRKISVQICFSSSSMARNMLLPTPERGQSYPSTKWKKLGLPEAHEIPGLDLRVTRKFFRPFGIVHSKYLIIDRNIAVFPSCNVSWERWYEVAATVKGDVVKNLFSFHLEYWRPGGLPVIDRDVSTNEADDVFFTGADSVPSLMTLLPSPHTPANLPDHLRPTSVLSQCGCMPARAASFPPTPLLAATHHLIATAKSSITVITPNLTAPAVLKAVEEALDRGVRVVVHTNKNLMTWEQLVTAGSTTPSCIQKLMQRSNMSRDVARGRLEVHYFDDDIVRRRKPRSVQDDVELGQEGYDKETTPVKLHAKVTIVDGKRIMFGSGNMDAASWKTSQELGVLIEDERVVRDFAAQWKYGDLAL